MDKLLSFTPEPFPELDREAEYDEMDPLAGEWEAEEAEEEVRRGRRPRLPRKALRRSVSKPTVRPRIQGRATGPRVKPLRQLPKLMPRPLPVPALRPVPIPFIPPLSGLRPDLEPAPPRDSQRPEESRRPEQAGSEGSGSPPTAQPSEEPPSEHVRWVQECLNRALGLQLPVDGVMNRETRSAIRTYQERRGLPITGLVGPETEAAMRSGCSAIEPPTQTFASTSAMDPQTTLLTAFPPPSGFGRSRSTYLTPFQPQMSQGDRELLSSDASNAKELSVRQSWPAPAPSLPASPPTALRHQPRAITFSEVKDDRISVPAQYSLVRLSKNPNTSGNAVGMVEAVKSGQLAGIYCVNWQKHAAKRAERLGKTWWTAIPKGEDAVLMLDPDNLANGPPLIAFRRELDPRDEGCGRLKTDTVLTPSPGRLDAALIRAWNVYSRFRARELVPCDLAGGAAVSPSGEPTVPETCRAGSPGLEPPAGHSCEYYAWIQSCLNRVLGTKLAITGVPDLQTRSALRTFRRGSVGQARVRLEQESPTDASLQAHCGAPSPCDRVGDEEDTGSCFQYIFGLKPPPPNIPNISAALTRAVGLPRCLDPRVQAKVNDLDDLMKILARMPSEADIRRNCPDLADNEPQFIRRRIEGLQFFMREQRQYRYPPSISREQQRRRRVIVCTAIAEIGKVRATKRDDAGELYGWRRLNYYFRCAYGSDSGWSTTRNGVSISWCGIFALWAVRSAGVRTRPWNSLLGGIFPPIPHSSRAPAPGDLGYIDKPHQHMNIVVARENGVIYTIDGNTKNYGNAINSNQFTKFAGGDVGETGCICIQGRSDTMYSGFYDPDRPFPTPKPSPVTYPFSL